jgi:hypothetical protein
MKYKYLINLIYLWLHTNPKKILTICTYFFPRHFWRLKPCQITSFRAFAILDLAFWRNFASKKKAVWEPATGISKGKKGIRYG